MRRFLLVGWLIPAYLSSTSSALAQSVSLGANFTTMTVRDVQNGTGTFLVPPDTTGAVGPNHFVQYNNGGLAIFNKDGSSVSGFLSETAFWRDRVGFTQTQADLAGGDPRLIFDPLSGRYFAVAFTTPSGSIGNQIYVARSDTADPNGSWKGVSFTPSTTLFADFPTLGVDRNGLYVATNNFSLSGSTFTFNRVDVISLPKADLLLAAPTAANRTNFNNTPTGFTTQPVNNFNLGQTSSTAGLLLSGSGGGNQLRITSVNASGGVNATLSATSTLTITNGVAPPDISGPNAAKTALTTSEVNTGDSRFGSTMYRVGDLVYLTRHVAVNGGVQSGIQVFVYNAVTNAVLAQLTLGGTADPNFNSFYPSIAANANGDFVVGYTRTGLVPGDPAASRWFSSYATVGNWNGSTLSFTSPIELHAGERDYVSFDASPKRWGDYSATNLDPSDPGVFWTTQEYASNITTTASATNWATRATELIPTVTGEKRWSSISATNARGISGDFNTAANWYGGQAPVSTDDVIFSRNGNGTAAGGYTVTMPTGATSIDRASVRQGFVTWSMGGNTLNLTNGNASTPSLAIAEYLGTANLTVSGGTLNTVTTTIGAGINSDASTNGIAGAFNPSNGALIVTGPGSTWNNSGDVFVGGSNSAAGGQGAITVSAEGRANVSGTTVLYNAAPGRPANQLTATTAGWYTTGGLTNTGSGTVVPVVNLPNAGGRLIVNGNFDSTFGGTITGSGSVTKSGTGTFTLTNTNDYSGATTVSAGTLALGSIGAITHTPSIAVGSGGTFDVSAVSNFTLGTITAQSLSGAGTVNGNVTAGTASTIRGGLNNGGTLDTLTVNGTVSVTGASTAGTRGRIGADLANLTAASGTFTRDLLVVNGSGNGLNFNTTNGAFDITLLNDGSLTHGGAYTITLATALNGATITNGGTTTFAYLSDFTITSTRFSDFENVSLVVDGTNLNLSFTPVPEPATVLGFGAGVLAIGASVRRLGKGMRASEGPSERPV